MHTNCGPAVLIVIQLFESVWIHIISWTCISFAIMAELRNAPPAMIDLLGSKASAEFPLMVYLIILQTIEHFMVQ